MKRWKKILSWALACVVLLVLAVFAIIYRSMQPTTGPRIDAYAMPRTALLVVDIQEDYTGPQARRRFRDGERIVAATNALLAQASAKNVLVIHIENTIDNPLLALLTGGLNAPGAPGTAMDHRLMPVSGSRTFSKNRSDAFSNPELDAYLRAQQVSRLLIVGLDGAYCVNATTQGALNRGYKVTLYSDGIATESDTTLDDLARHWRALGAEVSAGTAL